MYGGRGFDFWYPPYTTRFSFYQNLPNLFTTRLPYWQQQRQRMIENDMFESGNWHPSTRFSMNSWMTQPYLTTKPSLFGNWMTASPLFSTRFSPVPDIEGMVTTLKPSWDMSTTENGRINTLEPLSNSWYWMKAFIRTLAANKLTTSTTTTMEPTTIANEVYEKPEGSFRPLDLSQFGSIAQLNQTQLNELPVNKGVRRSVETTPIPKWWTLIIGKDSLLTTTNKPVDENLLTTNSNFEIISSTNSILKAVKKQEEANLACGRTIYQLNPEYPTPRGVVTVGQARINEFPWQVKINVGNGFLCGGSIISERFILTAAHCIVHRSVTDYQLVVGDHDRNRIDLHERAYDVKSIFVHPQYSTLKNAHDLALLETTSKQFSS